MHLQGCSEAVHVCIMAGRNLESSITQPSGTNDVHGGTILGQVEATEDKADPYPDVPRVDRKARLFNVHS